MSPPWPEADQTLGPPPWVRPPPGRGGVGARRPRARTLSTDLSPLDTQECTLKVQEGKFKLQDLLVVPMQRVLKYHLLLKVGLPLPAAGAASGLPGSLPGCGRHARTGGGCVRGPAAEPVCAQRAKVVQSVGDCSGRLRGVWHGDSS